ncbi:Berberine bridge enzyme-like 18 [Sesamum alatum]|uniref:Berberine bridge enzyme-like 18 n=1 Tax=Sesamum alatum TaxID=300844 RepID=A0AAE1Z1U9_9LAMI|nr:Berberine bridge enzyme-like 18 [Sesamum alatum]
MDSLGIMIRFLLLFFANLSVSSAQDHSTYFLQCITDQFVILNSDPSNVIYTPNNASYASLLLAQNLRAASTSTLKPLLIITPFYAHEIQAVVYCSKKLGTQIRVRSGGHDYEGLSYTSQIPFVVLDMRNFRSISINTEEKTAWVDVGATLGQLYYTIARHSRTLAFTAGVCPTVGIGGHISGGGYGMMSRKHSIAADHIIDARLMNADGQILDRRSMGEDLFWAIRGGGGTSFGILLAFKLELITVPETVTVFNVSKTLEENATDLVHRWQYIADKIDENLTLRLFLKSIRSRMHGNMTIQASFTSLYLGRVQELLPIMQEKFSELGLIEQDCTEMSWIESILYFAGLKDESPDILRCTSPTGIFERVYFKAKSDYVRKPIPMNGLIGIWRFLHEEGENMAEVQFSPYGGAMSIYSESKTPFAHRAGNIFMIHYAITWTRPKNGELENHVNWIRRLYNYMTPYVSKNPRAAYFNYRDLDLGMNNQSNTSYAQASVWGLKYFGNNFNRLVRVKTKVDPSNFFRNEQSIPSLSSWYNKDIGRWSS